MATFKFEFATFAHNDPEGEETRNFTITVEAKDIDEGARKAEYMFRTRHNGGRKVYEENCLGVIRIA